MGILIKFFSLFLLWPIQNLAWSLTPESTFLNEFIQIEDLVYRYSIFPGFKTLEASTIPHGPLAEKILKDPNGKVKDIFEASDYFYPNVKFWFGIYTHYSTHHVVIHDKSNLNLIYNIIDFSELNTTEINNYVQAKLQSKFSLDQIMSIRKAFERLSHVTSPSTETEKKLLSLIIQSGYIVPKDKLGRRRFFKQLSDGIRAQTGQRDVIFRGIIRSLPYLSFINKHLDLFELPHELLAVAFLESSFNPRAISKAGAAGAWQFMPSVGRAYLPMGLNQDGRLNPLLASIGAFHLLKQNYKTLGSWDLAVTAYNSGAKHLLRAKRILKKKNLRLDTIFKNYRHPHLGFASVNFYSEFLALVYVLAYKETIYPLNGLKTGPLENKKIRSARIEPYVSLCGFLPRKLFDSFTSISPHIRELNGHIRSENNFFGRGTIILSDQEMPRNRYYKLSEQEIINKIPRNWNKLISGLDCKMGS